MRHMEAIFCKAWSSHLRAFSIYYGVRFKQSYSMQSVWQAHRDFGK